MKCSESLAAFIQRRMWHNFCLFILKEIESTPCQEALFSVTRFSKSFHLGCVFNILKIESCFDAQLIAIRNQTMQ